MNSSQHAHVRKTTAQDAAERRTHFLVRCVRFDIQHGFRREDHSTQTESALRGALIYEGLLDGMGLLRRAETLERCDLILTNRADRDIDVFLMYPDTGQESILQKDIREGETSATRSDIYPGAACSSRGVLIARDKRGAEVARRTGLLCPGDTWVIMSSATSRGSQPNRSQARSTFSSGRPFASSSTSMSR